MEDGEKCADSSKTFAAHIETSVIDLFYCSWEQQELWKLIIRDNKNNAFFSR